MAGMPESMEKGDILEKLDVLLSDRKKRQSFLKDLHDLDELGLADNLVELGLRQDYAVFNPDEAKHFREHWLRDWWPTAQPIAPIIRQGLITAIKVASGATGTPRQGQGELPIDCYWACHPGHGHSESEPHEDADYEALDFVVTWSAHQVTVVIHSPDPPGPEGAPTNSEPILVVRWSAAKDQIIAVRP
jgi:hypothetical protein